MNNASTLQVRNLKPRDDMPRYITKSFNSFRQKYDFEDKRVLEIGGSSLSQDFLFEELRVRQWVSVDILGHSAGRYQQERFSSHYGEIPIYKIHAVPSEVKVDRYCIIDGDATQLPLDILGKFDVIVSVCCFEHVLAFPTVLQKCSDALKPNGYLFSRFGPIWSARVGHHIGIDKTWNHNNPGPLDNWAHLLYNPPELYQLLINQGMSNERAQKAILQTYHEPRINRLFYEDYVNYTSASAFTDVSISSSFTEDVPSDILEKLLHKHPGRSNFSTYGISLECRK